MTASDISREWRSRAACREIAGDVFFPTAERGRMRVREVAVAKAVCARCPVRAECLADALARIPYGIAGGLTAEERRALPRLAKAAVLDVERLAEALRVATVPRRQAALARALQAAGWSTDRIAECAGVSERTALRWAAALHSETSAISKTRTESRTSRRTSRGQMA
jgi:hypothetical protein